MILRVYLSPSRDVDLDSENVPAGGNVVTDWEATALARAMKQATRDRWIAARIDAWRAAQRERATDDSDTVGGTDDE